MTLADRLFALGPDVRYVATLVDGVLELRSQPGLQNASSSESDRYEELLVNPTMLTLLTQRGEIDCGGFLDVLVRYGYFFQFVARIPGGHVSVSLEPSVDFAVVQRVRETVAG